MRWHIAPQSMQNFEDEDDRMKRLAEWGLSTHHLLYKSTFDGSIEYCEIIGYVDSFTCVIQFEDKVLHTIHADYLKSMQKKNFFSDTVERTIAADSERTHSLVTLEPVSVQDTAAGQMALLL